MLFNDDIVAQRKAEAGSLASGFCRKERIEYLFLHLGRNAGTVVADSDFDAITEVLGCGSEGGLETASIRFRVALRRRVEALQDQIKQHTGNVLRENIGLASSRIQCS